MCDGDDDTESDQKEDKNDGCNDVFDTPNNGLNQYWYSDATKNTLHKLIVPSPDDQVPKRFKKVAFVGCPSAFFIVANDKRNEASCLLLEFDRRFEVEANKIGRFAFFDFNEDFEIASSHSHFQDCDLVICDPPYLSKSCWQGFIAAAMKLVKPTGDFLFTSVPENAQMQQNLITTTMSENPLLLNNDRMRDLRTTKFIPVQHGISHRFRFFATIAESQSTCLQQPNTADVVTIQEKENFALGQQSDNSDMDEIDSLFSTLQNACLSVLLEDHDQE